MEIFKDPAVATTFQNYPEIYQNSLLQVRERIYTVARQLSPEENVLETLKWKQPSYSIRHASPIRIDRFGEDKIALFFHCQTSLVETFREIFADELHFSKNRAIVLTPTETLPTEQLTICIQMALTYHKK